MKLSKNPQDRVIPTEKWKCFDDCPVCLVIKKAIKEGREIASEEFEKAFAEAEAKEASV